MTSTIEGGDKGQNFYQKLPTKWYELKIVEIGEGDGKKLEKNRMYFMDGPSFAFNC